MRGLCTSGISLQRHTKSTFVFTQSEKIKFNTFQSFRVRESSNKIKSYFNSFPCNCIDASIPANTTILMQVKLSSRRRWTICDRV
jgi:hypothetical protein